MYLTLNTADVRKAKTEENEPQFYLVPFSITGDYESYSNQLSIHLARIFYFSFVSCSEGHGYESMKREGHS